MDPVPGAASPQLRQLLHAILYQQHQVGDASSAAAAATASADGVGGEVEGVAAVSAAVLMLQLVVEARQRLRPIIQAGNSACGDR